MKEYNEEALIKRIRDFDEEARVRLNGCAPSASVVIMGGSAFVLSGLSDRLTRDIDVLSVPRELTEILDAHQMNTHVSAYIDSLPYNYENRLVDLYITNTFLQYLRPSIEDLIVTKLYAMRPPDVKDLSSPEVINQIDWNLLEHLIYNKDEAKASALNERRYDEMVQAYKYYKAEFCHEETIIS
jgi:hypothetical protein